jgi:hypothetical protein
MTSHRKKSDSQPNYIGQANLAHTQARALFALRLHLKALAETLSEDDAIAHPSGISINETEFHVDALSVVKRLGVSLTRASLSQIVACHHASDESRDPEIVAALRAIRICIEAAASLLWSLHFTNDARMVASVRSSEANNLCALALQKFAIKNMKKIEA